MLGSIDCMHWEWKNNCPTAYHGHYQQGKSHQPTIILLEAVASYDLWFWHAFFGLQGALNDINVLTQSPVFFRTLDGDSPLMDFEVNNNNHYTMGYYLADGIYPDYTTLVKTFPEPQTPRDKNFAQAQEKQQERTLNEHYLVFYKVDLRLSKALRVFWSPSDLRLIMRTCIILHNMIVQDERDTDLDVDDYENGTPPAVISREVSNGGGSFETFVNQIQNMKDREISARLIDDLAVHLYEFDKDEESGDTCMTGLRK